MIAKCILQNITSILNQIIFGIKGQFISKIVTVQSFIFIILPACFLCLANTAPFFWGFWAHQRINRLAVFSLPPEMQVFFKKHIDYLTENAVNPDKRRYAVVGEAPRHYIDAEVYGDSALYKLPLYWYDAVKKFGEDTLALNGTVPWAIQQYKSQLTEAFRRRDAQRILRIAADLGHYIADANVPLHTTRNYNGQRTGQEGIHAFWETRLPELYAEEYDMFVGRAVYEEKIALRAWRAVRQANAALDSVLQIEAELSKQMKPELKYTLEDRNGVVIKTYSREFSQKYHQLLNRQVERQMRASVKMVGDFWFTCWVDAGQPDLAPLASFSRNDSVKEEEEKEKNNWLQRLFIVRPENEK